MSFLENFLRHELHLPNDGPWMIAPRLGARHLPSLDCKRRAREGRDDVLYPGCRLLGLLFGGVRLGSGQHGNQHFAQGTGKPFEQILWRGAPVSRRVFGELKEGKGEFQSLFRTPAVAYAESGPP